MNTNERVKIHESIKCKKKQTNRKNTQEGNNKVRLKMGAEIKQRTARRFISKQKPWFLHKTRSQFNQKGNTGTQSKKQQTEAAVGVPGVKSN